MMGESPLSYGFGVRSVLAGKEDAGLISPGIADLFGGGDIVYGNLEAPISEKSEKNGWESGFFRADPGVMKILKNSRFNVLSLANNHIMEHGAQSFRRTEEILEKNGIVPVGIRNETRIIRKKQHTIAFSAYSFIEDFAPDSLYNKISSPAQIFEDIRQVRPRADIVVVGIHWGSEFVPLPSPDQVRLGRELIDAGADIILGCHPHVLQGYEVYRGRPIIYSMGNFIFDFSYLPETTKTVITKIEIDDNLNMVPSFIPVIIDRKNLSLTIAIGDEKMQIASSMDAVRNLLLNRSVEEYAQEIGDYAFHESGSRRSAKQCMKVHFVKNLYRYPPGLSMTIIKKFLAKKARS